jgi:hypothetical protein
MAQGYVVKTGSRDEVIPLVSIYEYDAVTIGAGFSKHQIGDKCRMSDGRVYHWALNGAVALTAGRLVQNSVTPIGHRNMTPTVLSAIGETKVQTVPVTTNIAANEYANGYLWMNAGAGAGIMYKVKSNPAITLSVAGYIYLYDPLVVATVVATSKVSLARNPWYGTLVMPTTITGIPVGVNPIAVPATTATIQYWYWCQTWGPATVLAGGTQVIGTPGVTPGTRVGGVIVQAAYGISVVGQLYNGLQVTDNENMGIFLQISQ